MFKWENLAVCVSSFVKGIDNVRVCTQVMATLHIETFVTVDFDPSLIAVLITDSNLDLIKCILGPGLQIRRSNKDNSGIIIQISS